MVFTPCISCRAHIFSTFVLIGQRSIWVDWSGVNAHPLLAEIHIPPTSLLRAAAGCPTHHCSMLQRQKTSVCWTKNSVGRWALIIHSSILGETCFRRMAWRLAERGRMKNDDELHLKKKRSAHHPKSFCSSLMPPLPPIWSTRQLWSCKISIAEFMITIGGE